LRLLFPQNLAAQFFAGALEVQKIFACCLLSENGFKFAVSHHYVIAMSERLRRSNRCLFIHISPPSLIYFYLCPHQRGMGAIAEKGHKKVADTFEVITDLYLI